MNHNKKEITQLSGKIRVRLYGDDRTKTKKISLSYNNLQDIKLFLEEKENALIKKMFLDYTNNFVSVDFFAECYGIDNKDALYIINKGRKLNNGSK
jgi:hypothetical protein